MLLFSATFKETVRAFAVQIVSNPIVIKLREEELTLSNIRQYYFVCRSREEKYRALCNIYGGITVGQAMIFCQVKQLSGQIHAVAVSRNGDGSFTAWREGETLEIKERTPASPGRVGNASPAAFKCGVFTASPLRLGTALCGVS